MKPARDNPPADPRGRRRALNVGVSTNDEMRSLILLIVLIAAPVAAIPVIGAAPGVHVDPRSDRVVGSRNSNVYHRPGCHHARAIYDRNLVSWPSAGAARDDGYRACRVCRPG